ncbi:hypothetical protein N7447_004588 [Penicillium robsamsonii]|uniref:uncharacterized protein n=1 Tax=Penicillium robsamsonii TaxID=1792511 RepID=UPI0025469798|nr:uncharacterized protein N7447_004588 [Penicillium robsamsonii]KAJ5827825.1 hypothetical protein N7447_004588 [Penicillium robsamsonii]
MQPANITKPVHIRPQNVIRRKLQPLTPVKNSLQPHRIIPDNSTSRQNNQQQLPNMPQPLLFTPKIPTQHIIQVILITSRIKVIANAGILPAQPSLNHLTNGKLFLLYSVQVK